MYLEMLYNRYGAALEKQAMEKQAIYLTDLAAGALGAVLGGVGSYAANPNASKKKIALTGGLTGGLAGLAGAPLLANISESPRIRPKTRLLAKLGVLSAPAIGGYLAEKIRSRGANN